MLYFLYGQESYLLKEALKELIFNLEQKNKGRKIEIKRADEEQGDCDEIFAQLNNLELFSAFRVLVIENVFKISGIENHLKKMLGRSPDDSNPNCAVIVLEQGLPKKNSKLFGFLLKNAKVKECRPLEGRELFEFAKKEFDKYGAKAQDSAVSELILRTGNNLWRLSKEIQKLSAAAKGKTVSPKDIALYVKSDQGVNIFDAITALALKQKAKALNLISRHLEKGENPLYLFSMIIYQFRVLIMIKDLLEKRFSLWQIQKKTGLHPFVIKKNIVPARLFSQRELRTIYRRLSQLDFQIKIGAVKPETALELFLAKPI